MSVKIIAFILLCMFSTSCISYQEVQLTNVSFKGVENGSDKFRVTLDVEVDNPNPYPIKLSKPKFKVFVAGQELQEWNCTKKVKIKKKAKLAYPFYVEVSGKEVMQLLPRLFMDPSIKIEGSIRAGSFLFGKRIPLSIEEKIY